MAAPKFYRPDQPFLTRCFYWWFEFFASLKLAVVLISTVAFVLAIATFVESNSGTAAVRFWIYHTKSFSFLMALLAMNIFFAAAIRYPWKKHQTGFVITHIGLLTLLAGSAISYRGSINSQLLVLDQQSNQIASDTAQGYLLFTGIPGRPEPFKVRFTPGPYNWHDLAPFPIVRKMNSLIGNDDLSKPWDHPDEVIYDQNGTKIEIVNFHSRSVVHHLPYLQLDFDVEIMGRKINKKKVLEYSGGAKHAKAVLEDEMTGMVMGEIYLWKSDQDNILEMLKETVPDRSVENNGMIVIWSHGETYSFSVDSLKDKKEKGETIELDDNRKIEFVKYVPSGNIEALVKGKGLVSMGPEANNPVVELKIIETIDGKEKTYRIFNFASFPFLPNHEDPDQFYSTFFHPAVKGRIDIIQDKNNKLAYRTWQQKAKRVAGSGDLELDKPVNTWSMTGLKTTWKMTLKEHLLPNDEKETFRVIPLPFSKENNNLQGLVQIRIQWNDKKSDKSETKTFWLRQNLPEPWESARNHQIEFIFLPTDKNDTIQASYHVMETDVGSTVKLIDFDLDKDPGTSMAANYTSQVIVIDVRDEEEVKNLREKIGKAESREDKQKVRIELASLKRKMVAEKLKTLENKTAKEQIKVSGTDHAMEFHLITMNAPLDYPDQHGRILRLFQENYQPPNPSKNVQMGSIFRVNYDPGRSLKYLGSLLITLGIFTMFYMKAYFFKKPPQASRKKKNNSDDDSNGQKSEQETKKEQTMEEIPSV
jgi:hypothetical protein